MRPFNARPIVLARPLSGRPRPAKIAAMTLCLAAVCDSGRAIACVFDEQLTTNETAGDLLSKGAKVNDYWLLMFAGDDIRHAGTVYDRVKRQLRARAGVSLPIAQGAVTSACDAVLCEDIEHGPLKLLKVTTREFVRRSHELVSDADQRDRLIAQVEGMRLGSDFLLAGFDERSLPHIVTFHDEHERTENHDREGFGLVGSGGIVARHHLVALRYTKHWPALTTVFALCAAKFIAESAMVGKKTNVAVLRSDASVWNTDSEQIRALWDTHGRPRMPVDIETKMPPLKQLLPKPTVPSRRPVGRAAQRVRKSPRHGQ